MKYGIQNMECTSRLVDTDGRELLASWIGRQVGRQVICKRAGLGRGT